MTSKTLREKAEEVVKKWCKLPPWEFGSGDEEDLIRLISNALHQAVLEKGKRDAEIARQSKCLWVESWKKYLEEDEAKDLTNQMAKEIAKEIEKEGE